jgi:EAL domain-containing protein (putative c-di-GMP-specific phosphodiesterase class I)
MVDGFGAYVNDLKKLNDLGFSISLDDFGTGYASFRHLQTLPLNTLKIDRSFLSGVPNNKEKNSTLDTMFSLAKIMRLSVVVEGVETLKQHQWLNRYHCAQQGFYHGIPSDSQKAAKYM